MKNNNDYEEYNYGVNVNGSYNDEFGLGTINLQFDILTSQYSFTFREPTLVLPIATITSKI